MQSLSIGRLHLSFKGCQVSYFILVLFRILFPVSKPCISAASDLGLLCFPVSLLWDVRYIWFNTVSFHCICGNHRHVFFSDKSANQLQLFIFTHIFAVRKRIRPQNSHIRLVNSQGYKAYPAVLSGDAFSCTVPRSAYNGLPKM